MKKIAVIGSHGSLKSTLCFKLAAYYKRKGYNVDLVQERVRYSPFPINKDMTIDTTLWISNACVQRELESKARNFDLIICDRSSIDSFIYADALSIERNNKIMESFFVSAFEWCKTYSYILIVDADNKLIIDKVRDDNLEFRERVNEFFMIFTFLFRINGIPYKVISAKDIENDKINYEDIINE